MLGYEGPVGYARHTSVESWLFQSKDTKYGFPTQYSSLLLLEQTTTSYRILYIPHFSLKLIMDQGYMQQTLIFLARIVVYTDLI